MMGRAQFQIGNRRTRMNSASHLPVYAAIDSIIRASRSGAVVLTSPAGSGKSTLVGPALLDDPSLRGIVYLLQPRRLAARALAHRIAVLRGTKLGGEIGYQVRFDSCTGPGTRLIVATTGVLLRSLVADVSLPGIGGVILDEFHERTSEMDLVLGMLVRIQQTIRPELRIIVMSATLDPGPVAALLGNASTIDVPGRMFPVEIRYERSRAADHLEQKIASAAAEAVAQTSGHVLAFLPGVGEINKCSAALEPLARKMALDLLQLYGDLPFDQQDRVLEQSARRKLILSTNIAETSLTIEGVTAVIDSGFARQLKHHADVGLPRLERVAISKTSADQRSGRAGRLMPGICWRLWSPASQAARPDFDPPEILRSDLSGPMLFLAHWGEQNAAAFPWLDRPADDAIELAFQLLAMLGAVDAQRRLTELGNQMVQLPAHPRLARLLIAGAEHDVLAESALAAALLSERSPFRTGKNSGVVDRPSIRSQCDIYDRVQALECLATGRPTPANLPVDRAAAKNIQRIAGQFRSLINLSRPPQTVDAETAVRKSLLAAYPDRLAALRAGSVDRGLMVGGRGVRIDASSNVRPERLFVCIEISAAAGDAKASLISAVARDWLDPQRTAAKSEMFFNPSRKQVESRRRVYWHDLLLEESAESIGDLSQAAALLAREAAKCLAEILPGEKDPSYSFRRRIEWLSQVMPELQLPELSDAAIAAILPDVAYGFRSFNDLRGLQWLQIFQSIIGSDRLAEINRLAPEFMAVPSGNRLPLQYVPGMAPAVAVRIQEIFGMRQTPSIAGGRAAIVMHLLGPNYRPQQITNDLASFWENGYPEIKKELRRRYPKHAWPDDPLSATPTRSGLSRDWKE